MNIHGIIWLQKIVEKLAKKHHLTQDEVEEALLNTPQYRVIERGKIEGERTRYDQSGAQTIWQKNVIPFLNT